MTRSHITRFKLSGVLLKDRRGKLICHLDGVLRKFSFYKWWENPSVTVPVKDYTGEGGSLSSRVIFLSLRYTQMNFPPKCCIRSFLIGSLRASLLN